MNQALPYRQGQRWEFKSDVAEFERTLVIGLVTDADPQWGANEVRYEVYVRYSALAKDSIPPDFDGVVLSLTAEGLDRSVTKLVESGVQLPWWWRYGRRFATRSDATGGFTSCSAENVSDVLPTLFLMAQQTAGDSRSKADAVQQHLRKFKKRKRRAPPSKSIAESWERVVAWLREHAPGYSFRLNSGASDTAISAFEQTIGAELPQDFKESLRLHDGGDDCWVPPDHGELLSLDRIKQQWEMYRSWQEKGDYAVGEASIPREIKGPIKPVFWNLKRIYITDNSGDHLTLDLDPPPDGVYGQILDHSHEVGPTEVLAPSWSAFLRQLVDDLETGKYVYIEDEGALEPLKWLQDRTRG
jgi:cell wall assembly regulator SMI1